MARHYGIPYMGSKQKLVDKIVPFILNRHPNTVHFYDLFGGGGSISLYAVRKYPNLNCYYNELSTAVGGLMQHLKNGGDIPMEFITREEFKNKWNLGDWYSGIIQTCWTFGNKTDGTYLYGKDIQDYKHELHKAVVDGAQNFSKIETMAKDILIRDYGKNLSFHVLINPKYKTIYQRRIVLNRQIPLIGAMQHLGRLERLVQIEHMPGINRLAITFGIGYDQVPIVGGGANCGLL